MERDWLDYRCTIPLFEWPDVRQVSNRLRNFVPVAAAADRYMPVDRRASRASSRTIPVLLDAIRFPSDPPGTILEQNDAVLLLRSDDPSALREGHARLVDALDLWTPTSIRRGFVGGGFDAAMMPREHDVRHADVAVGRAAQNRGTFQLPPVELLSVGREDQVCHAFGACARRVLGSLSFG